MGSHKAYTNVKNLLQPELYCLRYNIIIVLWSSEIKLNIKINLLVT